MDFCWNTLFEKLTASEVPLKTFKYVANSPSPMDFSNLMNEIIKGAHDFENIVVEEAALVSRLVYLYKNPLRHDKGFNALRKVNASFRQWRTLNLLEKLYKFKYSVHYEVGPSSRGFEWGLSSLFYFVYLCHRLCNSSMEAGSYFKLRVSDLDHLNMNIVLFAEVSRIWQITACFFQASSKWYDKLYPFLTICKRSKGSWLPDNCILPEKIENCLILSAVPDTFHCKASQKLAEDTCVSFEKSNPSFTEYFASEDIGVPVSQGIVKEKHKRAYIPPFSASMVCHLTTVDQIRYFLARERVLRKQTKSKALLNHLSQPEWEKCISQIKRSLDLVRDRQNEKEVSRLIKNVRQTIKFFYNRAKRDPFAQAQ